MRFFALTSALIAITALGCQNEAGQGRAANAVTPESLPSTPTPLKELEPDPVQSVIGKKNPDRLYQLSKLGKGTIKVNGKSVPVWLMNDGGKRQEGMMFLTPSEVKSHEGMLFVFPSEQGADHGFWMSNTILPLDIIYISKDFKVVNAVKGKPYDETDLPAGLPFQYVLELREGEAARLKIKKGTSVEIPVSLRKAS